MSFEMSGIGDGSREACWLELEVELRKVEASTTDGATAVFVWEFRELAQRIRLAIQRHTLFTAP